MIACLQFGFCPHLILRLRDDGRVLRLCTGGLHLALPVIIHDGGYFGVAGDMFLSRETVVRRVRSQQIYRSTSCSPGSAFAFSHDVEKLRTYLRFRLSTGFRCVPLSSRPPPLDLFPTLDQDHSGSIRRCLYETRFDRISSLLPQRGCRC